MTGVRGCWQQPSQGNTELLEAAPTNRFSQLYQVKVLLFSMENTLDLKDMDDDEKLALPL